MATGEDGLQVLLRVWIGRKERPEDTEEDQRDHEEEAEDGETVLEEPAPCITP
jgi:hypothetical protein